MKKNFKHLITIPFYLAAALAPDAGAATKPVVNVGCVEANAYTQHHIFDRTPIVVKAGATNSFPAAPSLVIASSPIVREWEVEVAKPSIFTNATFSLTNVMARFGLLSAVPGTITAQLLDRDGAWKNTAVDSGGKLVIPSMRTMPKGAGQVVGAVDYQKGELLADLCRWGRYLSATNVLAGTNAIRARVRVAWTPNGYSGGIAYVPLPFEAPPSTNIICSMFADVNGDGAWTPGEPFGATSECSSFWGQTTLTGGVGLTDTSPSVMRFDIKGMMVNNTFAAQATLNDRGMLGMEANPNTAHLMPGTEMDTAPDGVRLRIVQCGVNDVYYYRVNSTTTRYANEVVFDKVVDTAAVPCFTEALLMAKNDIRTRNDLDWNQIGAAAGQLNISWESVESVTYRVVVGNGPVDVISTNNVLATRFVNAYNHGTSQPKAVPIAPAGINSKASVGFSWRHDSTRKDYPAFRLRVYKTPSGDLVYDSGVRRAPPRDVNGVYTWNPDDLLVGEATREGRMFKNNAYYTWKVSMLDAKFTTPNSDETACSFTNVVP